MAIEEKITDPKVLKMLRELLDSGKLQAGNVSLTVLSDTKIGDGRIAFITGQTKGSPETAQRLAALEQARDNLLALVKKHKVPSEVQKAFYDLINITVDLVDLRVSERDSAYRTAAMMPQKTLSLAGQARAKSRHKNDPKRAAKLEALELWKEWRGGKHTKLRTTEQYAIEVMNRWPILTSAKVICGWSAKWNKEAAAGKTPAC